MRTVSRSIEIHASRVEVARAWSMFVDSVLIGRRRLACDEVSCVSAVDRGFVAFGAVAADKTRVTLNIPLSMEEPDEARELVEHKASHDLVAFWDYVDGGDYHAEWSRHVSDDERRSGKHSMREYAADNTEQLSARRTGRA